jgi:hypothetical protein
MLIILRSGCENTCRKGLCAGAVHDNGQKVVVVLVGQTKTVKEQFKTRKIFKK